MRPVGARAAADVELGLQVVSLEIFASVHSHFIRLAVLGAHRASPTRPGFAGLRTSRSKCSLPPARFHADADRLTPKSAKLDASGGADGGEGWCSWIVVSDQAMLIARIGGAL